MTPASASSDAKPLIGITCMTHVVPAKAEGLDSTIHFRGPQSYVDCIVRAGGTPVLLPSVEDEGFIAELLRTLDGVLVSGGDDAEPSLFGEQPHPKLGPVDGLKGRFEAALMRAALEARMPLLGICGGMQMLNVVCGGTLHQDIASCTDSTLQHQDVDPQRPPTHNIEIVSGTRLHTILGATQIRVNSTHHQAINALGKGLTATAHAPDGLIEAIERPDSPFTLGIQFHPELLAPHNPTFQRIFEVLVECSVRRRAGLA